MIEGPIVCPVCGLEVIDFDRKQESGTTCNPIRSPDCWKVIGKSKNGGPLLHIVQEG